MTLALLLRPVPFEEFAHTDRATEFYITTVDDDMHLAKARPDRTAVQPLLDLLEAGSVRLCGRFRYSTWDSGQSI